MTIIEVLIVIAVFALMVGMVLVGFSTSRTAEVIRGVNQVANTMRYGYDKARVNGTYHRMLINIDDRSFSLQEGDDRMYLPATDRDGKLVEFDSAKEEERAERDKRAEEAYNRSLQSQVYNQGDDGGGGGSGGQNLSEYDAYKPQPKTVPRRKPPMFSGFEEENTISGLAKPVKLPEGVKIVSVRTDADLKPITDGETSIYFFPQGRTQKAHIQLEETDYDGKWTIKLSPLTGRVEIVEGHEDLVLPDDPDDEVDDLGRDYQRRTF